MLLLDIYLVSLMVYFACVSTVYICSRAVSEYTRNKDIKNTCSFLIKNVKSQALPWGIVWPVWLAKLALKK